MAKQPCNHSKSLDIVVGKTYGTLKLNANRPAVHIYYYGENMK